MNTETLEKGLAELGFDVRDSRVQFHSSSLFPLYRWEVRLQDHSEHLFALKMLDRLDMAEAEVDGLRSLKAWGVRTPNVIGILSDDHHYIIMDFIGHRSVNREQADADLMQSLQALYANDADRFGYSRMNFVGSLEQKNGFHEKFLDFWWSERIAPMFIRARRDGRLGGLSESELKYAVDASAERLNLLDERPVAVHGDLWNGNVIFSDDRAYLIDPSVAFSIPEQDFAMLQLFGSPLSIGSFRELRPGVDIDTLRGRITFFQLYPLLVHVVLFGASYERQTVQLIRSLSQA